MIVDTRAKIFLSEERGMSETTSFRSFQTFNFGKYSNENKQPVGDLYLLNDDTLEGSRSLSMLVQENSFIVLLPVAGAIIYNDGLAHENIIAAGQVQIFYLKKDTTISISNPFRDQPVNFIQLWFRQPTPQPMSQPMLVTYDVNSKTGGLVTVTGDGWSNFQIPFQLSVGKFNGRDETVYRHDNKKAVFVFVLEGAFEVEGRLLHARDGLALWESAAVEMEALSNNAILLLTELQP